ncbi:hypothetical protein O3M35_006416 [Rhynocoris fuscipes]|uniref:Cell growth-regulating nucleolar protein n=1 Tax=Rhynocoris fuscipes TaxID=488301 RepID=A0AAW1DDM7_9HEMI
MVVFTCQKCNSTLKKNAVEKHFSCRPFFLTCIDCLKDFRGNEYESHTSCITEAEKYGGGKAVVKQASVKQDKWLGTAQEILSEISKNPKYHKFCGLLKQASNLPRNRNKFHNFVRSAHPRIYNSEIINEIFDHLEKGKINKNEPNSSTTKLNSNSENTIENNENNLKKKKKKDKNKNENSESINELPAQNEDEIKNSKKRTLNETDFQSNEQQNGTNEKKFKHEIKKKKKNLSDNPDICEDVNNFTNKESEVEVNGNELNEETNGEKLNEETNGLKLSKKERKKLKKLQKYNAEVAEILSVQPEENPVNLEEENNVEKKKKKKKVKDEGKEAETEQSVEVSPKRKHEITDADEDIAGKKIKLNDTLTEENIQIESGKKFKWGQIIKQILENSSGNELSLKKLRKKVINEYLAQKGDDTPYEKLLGTFNKKINSTEGVKIIKDKVQLVLT